MFSGSERRPGVKKCLKLVDALKRAFHALKVQKTLQRGCDVFMMVKGVSCAAEHKNSAALLNFSFFF